MYVKRIISSLLAVCTIASITSAQVITPTGTFGPQPTFTFGGTGIPNNAVMTNTNAGTLGVTLGLSASQRCGNSPSGFICDGTVVTNDGAGTFFASAGTGNVNPSPGDPYATWNFNYYIGGANAANYNYKLFYDFDPAFGNSGNYGNLTIAPVPSQDSWNLGMNFLGNPSVLPGYIFPPPGTFNPNAQGEYSFALIAYRNELDGSLREVGRSAINVNTSTVPEPSTYLLMASGLAALGFVARKRRKALEVLS